MPYFITQDAEGCTGWGVVKADGEVLGCHTSKQAAINQMVALSIAEGIDPGGERVMISESRQLPDNFRPALSDDVPEGRACGNCRFYDDTNVQNDEAWCQRWNEYVRGDYYCNAWEPREDSARFYTERVEMQNVEVRTFEAEIRAVDESSDGMTFGGYAWRYNEPSLPLPFIERIAPGAFTRTLKSRNDVRAYYNHNDELLLGSSRAKTLRIEDRPDGGWVEIDLPDTELGRSVSYHVNRGDITGMSFGFSTVRDEWSADGNERTLKEVRLHEVSVVSGVPAYPTTTSSVRNLKVIAHRTEMDADALADAMNALQAGELNDDQAGILRTVVDRMTGTESEPEAEQTIPLSVLQKQMDLLAKAL